MVHAIHAVREETLEDLVRELDHAVMMNGLFRSAHEFLGVLDEEVWEVKQEIYKQRDKYNMSKMYEEAIQVAAVALRFADEIRSNLHHG